MSKGYTGKFLRIDLTDKTTKVETYNQDFYRKYLGGGGFGTYFLLKETDADTDPLSPENVVTIAPGITTGSAVSGVSRCGLTALSPETGGVGDSQAGGSFGPSLKRAGWDAVIITGKAAKMSYIYIEDDNISILDAEKVSGRTILDARTLFEEMYGKKGVSVMQCGPAGCRKTVKAESPYQVTDKLGGPEFEDLVKFSTGMDMTFWELMMAGERKITMMRLVNLRRGFTDKDDKLPAKMFEPLYDGPSKGRSVNEDDFNRMKTEYYGFLGWDDSGIPRPGKLAELGLDWAV